VISLVLGVAAAPAQSVSPRLGYVYPAGGRQGATLEVVLGGQFLDGATNAFVSGTGVTVTVLEHTKPLTQQQFQNLREQLEKLQQKRTASLRGQRKRGPGAEGIAATNRWTAADEKTLEEIRMKLASFQRRPANPAIAEKVRLRVALEPQAEPGTRELRLETALGLSNPLVFCVGQFPEFSRRDARPAAASGYKRPARNREEPGASPPTETRITLPATVNGQLPAGGVDRFRFYAAKGQHLVFVVSARGLIPYLPDAVPGWFQATLGLFDAKGNELAYDDDYRFHPDPVLHYEVQADGEYLVEIKDSIYRGREDFVYRITLGELPFITGVFPLGAEAGAEAKIELTGWNLPTTNLVRRCRSTAGLEPVSVAKDKLNSNLVPFEVGELPEVSEQKSTRLDDAQKITLPVVINGRIEKPGDVDHFAFAGRAGEQVVLEVTARRLDSPLDSILQLLDPAGKQVAANDDCEDKGSGLNTHHADSYLTATLPVDGTYTVVLGDTQRKGGREYGYRLRVSNPRPDFALRISPSSLNVRPGMSAPVSVFAMRKDGFTNEIKLALKGAPAGLALAGAIIPAGQDQVRLTLGVPPGFSKGPCPLAWEGEAVVSGRLVRHEAIPAEDMMQAFAYRHLVPVQTFQVTGIGRGFPRANLRVLAASPVKIPVGGSARVPLSGPAFGLADRVQFELSDPPEAISMRASPGASGMELILECDAGKAKPGQKGNLIVNLLPGKNAGQSAKGKGGNNNRRIVVGTLPAIPFEIVTK
jgi:hypothetical protein